MKYEFFFFFKSSIIEILNFLQFGFECIIGIFINVIILLSKNNFEITIGSTIILNIFCYIFAYIFRWICNVSIKVLRHEYIYILQDILNHDMFS